MALPQLHMEELSILDDLEQNTMDGAFYGNTNGALPLVNNQGNSIVQRDANLASTWLNTNVIKIDDQNEIFSDTESLTSCGSAVASPAVFEQNDQNHFSFLEDQELKQLSVKDLNLKLKGLPKEIVKAAKKRRRTLKNRGYAHSCRIKRIQEKSSLQRSKAELEAIITGLQQQVTTVSNERDMYKNRFESLVQHLKMQLQTGTISG